jgi:ABC-type lipoprotein release transport system permease subunit
MLDTGNVASSMMLYGLSPEELRHLEKEKALALIDGGPLFDSEYGAYVSADTADKNGIWVGDYITLDAATAAGLMNTMDFQIQGVYANGAPWDNIAVYVREQDARALMEWDPALFSSARIYLKDPGKRAELARELDGYLREAGGVLRAEPSDVSLRFWSALAGLLKGIFTFFVVFLLLVIALGIRSTIRMNLFQRIQEFGTLRAIGFTRPQAFLVIFTEIFTISLLALASAAGFSTLLVAILSRTGIYLGSGAAAYALGSEYVYPALTALDLVTALAIVTGFSLLSPLRPGLKLCYQKIIDMLARRQRRVSVFGSLIRRRSQGGPL